MSDPGGSGGGGGGGVGGGVLYKRIPPPCPEPQYDGPCFPTSPSSEFECYPERYGSMADYIPAGNRHHGLSDDYHDYWARNPANVPTYNIGGDFSAIDAMYKDDDCGLTAAADLERQTNEYITAALDHYNSQDQNQVKYELVQAIASAAIFSARGFYGHVNFMAKGNLENSKEEFLFAELYYDSDSDVYKPTCIVSLQGRERVGGVRGMESAGVYYGKEIPIDPQHCYACLEEVKHPKDGTLYEIGHHVGGLYGYLD